MSERPIQILLVEDNAAGVHLTLTALRDARSSSEVHVVADGEAALAFLMRTGDHAKAPRPDIVFLDLNLPKVDGYQVLAAMKAGQVPTGLMNTHRATLDEFIDVLPLWMDPASGVIKAVIEV